MTTRDGDNSVQAPLPQIVGFRLRRLRELVGLRQEDIASQARNFGLDWSRSSVAMLEAGNRKLSAEELLILPFVLGEAVRKMTKGNAEFLVSLADLVKPGRTETLRLASGFGLRPSAVEAWLDRVPPSVHLKAVQRFGEAEQKTARLLGVTVTDLMAAAQRLWHRTLTEERDRRAALKSDEGELTPERRRSLQAVRGQVTRQLTEELRAALDLASREKD